MRYHHHHHHRRHHHHHLLLLHHHHHAHAGPTESMTSPSDSGDEVPCASQQNLATAPGSKLFTVTEGPPGRLGTACQILNLRRPSVTLNPSSGLHRAQFRRIKNLLLTACARAASQSALYILTSLSIEIQQTSHRASPKGVLTVAEINSGTTPTNRAPGEFLGVAPLQGRHIRLQLLDVRLARPQLEKALRNFRSHKRGGTLARWRCK